MEIMQKIKKFVNKKEKSVELKKNLEKLKLNTLKKDLEKLKLNTLNNNKKIIIKHDNNIKQVDEKIDGSFLSCDCNYYEVYHWKKEEEKLKEKPQEEYQYTYAIDDDCIPCAFSGFIAKASIIIVITTFIIMAIIHILNKIHH